MRSNNVTCSIPSEGTDGIPTTEVHPVPAGMSIAAKCRLRVQNAAALMDGMPDSIVSMNINPSDYSEKGQ
jgi:hypothetical protein